MAAPINNSRDPQRLIVTPPLVRDQIKIIRT
jgi:hypothetical protein